MNKVDIRYRKNLGLLIAFLVFVTVLFVIAAFFARTITRNFVETEFNNRKVEVFDASIQPFNEFFNDKIPEISFYQGYLDSVQASEYSNTILRKYPFVEEVNFFDIQIANKDSLSKGVRFNNLGIFPKAIYNFTLNNNYKLIGKHQDDISFKTYADEFNNMILKLASFLDRTSDSTVIAESEIYKVFYSLQPGKISYLNIPRMSDIMAYKSIMRNPNLKATTYEQDLFIFKIEPSKIIIKNTFENLYEHIHIKPVVDPFISENHLFMSTDLPLPGALSDYKLQFESSKEFIQKEINKRFLPVMIILLVIYLILLLIGYLTYRNVSINSKLYQLQYDFINNLTHEFKTPVSVIKIAGNNIRSAEKISDQERTMYGRILDQEADKLNNLMNKLLSYAQIENKSIKFHGEYIALNEFCSQIFEASKIKYPDMNIDYEVNTTKEIFVDPVLLSAVFQNMVDNAYKYSSPGRRSLKVSVEQNKKNFVILFKDQGIGIDKKEFNSIFKKFYRVKNQFNQQGSIGLGLAFCKEITEFMGGEIKIESQLGVGTIFTIVFPIEVKKV